MDQGHFALFVTEESTNSSLREVLYTTGNESSQVSNYMVSTLAGGSSSYVDGDGNSARFNGAQGLFVVPAAGPSATLFVADSGNNRLRKVFVPSGALLSGGAGSGVSE